MRAHTGARVSPLSIDEIEEIFATRIGIEGWLARHGAARLTDDVVAAMAELLDELRRAQAADEREDYLRLSFALRARCYEAAGKPRLLDRFIALYAHSRRYVFLTIAEASRFEQSRTDMERFFAACETRDGMAAHAAIQDALQHTLVYLVDAFDRTEAPTRS